MQLVDAVLQLRPLGVAVTVYFVMGTPPSKVGADQLTLT